MLNSVEAIIEAVGGNAAACALAGASSPSAPSNWKARGRMPAEKFLVFSEALRAVGKTADPAVFGIERAEARS